MDFDSLYRWIELLLIKLNLPIYSSEGIVTAIIFSVIAIAVFLLTYFLRGIVLKILRKLIEKSPTQLDDILLKHHLFEKITALIPVILIYIFAKTIFAEEMIWLGVLIGRTMQIILLAIVYISISAMLNCLVDYAHLHPALKDKPVKSTTQLIKVILGVLLIILAISIIIHKSPLILLSGLGAMTAVLLLVFRDTILGFVASLQISFQDMVKVGDWIEMPKYGADGTVLDISLNTVKVQNWDNTIVSFPTYALASDAFKNWEGMSRSGGRRIKRAIYLDIDSVKFLDEKLIKKLQKFKYLEQYIQEKTNELKESNSKFSKAEKYNHRRLTNIGTFRAYVHNYLLHHPEINTELTLIVRQLAPTERGLPLEIYTFVSNKQWAAYESIQSDIFDHLLAVVDKFDLKVFQAPSGSDLRGLR